MSSPSHRRALSKEYKERRQVGGVYTITNTVNGKYILGYAANLASVRNRFEFSVKTGSTMDSRLRADWAALGPRAFTLEVREELEQGPDQSAAAFLEDLKTLQELWRGNLDASKAY